MESKKINQLATSVNPQTSDLTIIGDPVTGVSKKITLLQIANLFATTGTVSSVAVTETGDALTITGSPITSAGTINIGFAGAANQYVRGDGALADFPTSTGGGSSVSYYLNSSVSQGTIGGVAYRELNKEPVIGAGTDITISANGYIASYITDANDPDVLSVPGGNFNCEFYFSVNSNAHNPSFYAELYKYDGTTFTLLGSSQAVPEYLSNGTTISPYYFAIPVPTTALALTDRLAIRIYVDVDTRIVTLHTENSHLCQVVTTFSKGMVSLNNLTDQSQFITTGTSGTNFNIVSSGDTHTFNLPVASATNTGKLSNTDWSTFNAKQPAGNYVTLDTTQTITAAKTISGLLTVNNKIYLQTDLSTTGVYLQSYNSNEFSIGATSGATTYYSNFILQGADRNYSFPNTDGTIALTSNIPANIVTGTGTTNTLPKFTGTSAIGNSNITDTGSLITLGSNSYLNGSVGIGSTPSTNIGLLVGKNITGGVTSYGTYSNGTIQSDVTTNATFNATFIGTAAASFTVNNAYGHYVAGTTIGAGSAISTQQAYYAHSNFTGATNNYGFRGAIPAGTNRWNIYMDGTANNYLAGSLGIGSTSLSTANVRISKSMSGSTTYNGVLLDGQIQSDNNNNANYFSSVSSTQATAFTLNNLNHYIASQGTFGAGSAVTTQRGFWAQSSLVGAGTDIGFQGSLPSGTNNWNLYMDGTAANYMAGNTFIGATTDDTISRLQVYGTNWAANFNVTASGGINLTRTNAVGNNSTHYSIVFKNADSAVAAFNTINRTGATASTGTGYELNISTAGTGYITQSTNGVERVRVKSQGQMRFVPLAADPSGAEAGDVYYNSTINALKLYDGTVWRTITVI